MNAKICRAAVTAGAAMAAAAAMASTWVVRDGTGATPRAALDWTDGANWADEVVGGGEGDVISFKAGSAGAHYFVRIPAGGVTIDRAEFSETGARFTFIGGPVRVAGTKRQLHGGVSEDRMQWFVEKITAAEGGVTIYGGKVAAPFEFENAEGKLAVGSVGKQMAYLRNRFALDTGRELEFVPGAKRISMAQAFAVVAPKRGGAAEAACELEAGSAYARLTGSVKGADLSAGQNVAAAGALPAGTWVKRIFNDEWIELSAAATAGGAHVLTAAAFGEYRMRQELDKLEVVTGTIYLQREDGADAEVAVKEFWVADGKGFSPSFSEYQYWAGNATVDGTPGPARVVAEAAPARIEMRGGRIAFAGDAAVEEIGFYSPDNHGKNCHGWFEAAAGKTVTVGNVKDWAGTIIKDGEGEMVLNTGLAGMSRLEVRAGLLRFGSVGAGAELARATVKAGGTLEWNAGLAVRELAVEAGAAIRVPAGATFDAAGRDLPAGVIFEGAGRVEGCGNPKGSGWIFRGGVTVATGGPEGNLVMGNVLNAELPERVTPAFWVSAKAEGTLTYGGENGKLITRWEDCRGGAEEGYHFATNAMPGGFRHTAGGTELYPSIRNDNSGRGMVFMRKGLALDGEDDAGKSPALVWDEPITGIKAVFSVVGGLYDNNNGGGSILGATKRLGNCDFLRREVHAWCGNRAVAENADVWNAPYYVNGHLPEDGKELAGYARAKPMLAGCFTQVIDIHPLGEGASADCWGFQWQAPNAYGGWIGECLVYTNAVTDAERRQIENYLMKKWFGGGVVGTEVAPAEQDLGKLETGAGGVTVEIAAGDAAVADALTGSDGMVKSGAGTLYLRGVQTEGTVRVEGGKLSVRSADATDPAGLPGGALLHLDANDDASFPGATDNGDGTQGVAEWRDARGAEGGAYLARPNANYAKPVRRVEEGAFARAMKVVDYGELHCTEDAGWAKGSSGWYGAEGDTKAHAIFDGGEITNCTGLTAAFAVFRADKRGGQLLGSCDGKRGDGLKRDYTGAADGETALIAGGYENVGGVFDSNRRLTQADIGWEALTLADGEKVVPLETAPSGGWQTWSMLSPYGFSASAIGMRSYRNVVGGVGVGELLLYGRMLTEDEARRVDAYLGHKWFGREPGAEWRPAKAGRIEVGAGAVLEVTGGAAFTAGAVGGEGGVEGDLALAAGGALEVAVREDGTVGALGVSGAFRLPADGVVRLAGAADGLGIGRHTIAVAGALEHDGDWAVEGYGGRNQVKVRRNGNALELNCSAKGTLIMLR